MSKRFSRRILMFIEYVVDALGSDQKIHNGRLGVSNTPQWSILSSRDGSNFTWSGGIKKKAGANTFFNINLYNCSKKPFFRSKSIGYLKWLREQRRCLTKKGRRLCKNKTYFQGSLYFFFFCFFLRSFSFLVILGSRS